MTSPVIELEHLQRGYVVERYFYTRESGKKGTQWIVHEIRAPGTWHTLAVMKTRREAFAALQALEHR